MNKYLVSGKLFYREGDRASAAVAHSDYAAVRGDDDVDRHIMLIGLNLIKQLTAVGHTHFKRTGVGQQPIVESLATPYAIATAVVCNSRHHYKIYILHIYHFITFRLLYLESTVAQMTAVVWEYVKVYAIDARKEKGFRRVPLVKEVKSGELIGERVIHQHIFCHHKSRQTLEA